MDTNKIQFQSQTWVALRKHLEKERQYYLELLTNDQSETETAKLRGRIAQLTDLIDLQRDPTF